MEQSALLVPVPEAEPVVGRWRAARDPSARAGLPAHITVLYPFVPPPLLDAGVEGALAGVLAAFHTFPFRLTRTATFPGVLYVAAEPPQPFVDLTNAMSHRWPEHPPYEGRYVDVVPHLTVAMGRRVRSVARRVEHGLPIDATARELWLMTSGTTGRWSARRRFSLG